MKRITLLATIASLAMYAGAIEIENTAGQLSENITDTSVDVLTVTGTMDARDFKFIGEKLTHLLTLNISQAEIVAFSDPQGTLNGGTFNYEALTLPSTMLMNSPISSIVLPTGLKSIGQAALAGCANLSTITLPEGLESIGDFAFNGSGLTQISVPAQVTIIGNGAFSRCYSLQSVTIENASIGNYAFLGDTSLSSVNIGSGVTAIGDAAFSGCTSMAGLTIPNNCNIASIGIEAFAGSGLETINLYAMPQLKTIGAWAFSNTPIQIIDVPSTVTSIGEGAFFYAQSLQDASLPMFNKINDYTFAGNTSLTTQDIISDGVESIGNYAFYGATAIDTLRLPPSIKYIGTKAMAGMTGLKEIIVLGNVALLGDSVWAGVDQPNVALNTMRDADVGHMFGQAEQWKDFHILLAYLLGDVNNDTRINVLDITTTVEYIMNNDPQPFVFPSADVVVDQSINVLDITGIVGLIMNHEYNTIYAAPRQGAGTTMLTTDDNLSIEGLSLRPGETTTVAICMNNDQNYTALQCDLHLSEGLELADMNIVTTERTSRHSCAIKKAEDGSYRIVAFAPNNADITGNEGAIMLLNVKATEYLSSASGIEIDNICFADRSQDYYALASYTPVSTITGVDDVTTTTASVRGDYGMLIIDSTEATTAQIVNASGMTVVVNVSAGTNQYSLDGGIYMVRIGSKTYKVIVK